jgi:uncharacterized protein (TIGR03663 family)
MIDNYSPQPSRLEDLREWLGQSAWFGLNRGELFLYLAILALATGLRFHDLGSRTFHHDEAIHAKESLEMIRGKQYRYNPAYHGPLLYFSNNLLFAAIGADDTTARLIPAAIGVAAVAALAMFRPELGRVGTPLAMTVMTLSTSFIYYSRFIRNDIYVAFFTLVLMGALLRYIAHPRRRWIYLAWIMLGFSFVTKENTYIHGVLLVMVLAVFSIVTWRTSRRAWRPSSSVSSQIQQAVTHLQRDAEHVVYGFLIFTIITFVFYTSFLTNLTGFRDAFVDSVSYWTEVHESERVNQPWFYYPMFMLVYEPFALLVGAFALTRLGTARTPMPLILALWGVAGMAIYSTLGEKAPWLVLHVMWPFLVLASWYAGRRLESLQPSVLRVAMGVIVVGLLAWTVRFGMPTIFERGDEPIDFVMYVQSAPDVLDAVEAIEVSGQITGDANYVRAVVDNEFAWPLAWYLRNYPNIAYEKEVTLEEALSAPVVLLKKDQAAQFRLETQGYSAKTLPLRRWFPEFAYQRWTFGFIGEFLTDQEAQASFWDWLVHREEPPIPVGTFDYVLHIRDDVAAVMPTR